ncbi:hypothetical protein C2G38_2222604 [Gigaspora rosea]|uniref:Uncharacterized protein n=1 Tax=Gigaspora rosea TaxID=44941 RepID=A0A397U239_9GLOM|nr:hypothetical protein C2G38_2222604 [Gigaspora rosea]
MKCTVSESVKAKCDEFGSNFNNSDTSQATRNIFHDKTWKESDRKLLEITERTLNTLLSSIPIPKNAGVDKERMEKIPDIMGLLKHDGKIVEFMFAECSRIICCNSKKDDGDVKLWRETLDGMSFIDSLCRPTGNQFGVVGIQVAGTTIRLNVLVRDLGGIPRYFHLDHAEIPLSPHLLHTKALIRLLSTLRNILIVNKSLLMKALEQAHPEMSTQVPLFHHQPEKNR